MPARTVLRQRRASGVRLAVCLLAGATFSLRSSVEVSSSGRPASAASAAFAGPAAPLAGAGAAATGAARGSPAPGPGGAAAAGTQWGPGAAEEPQPGSPWRALRAALSALALCAALLGPPRLAGSSLVAGPEPASAGAYSTAGTFASGAKVNKDPVSLLQYALPIEETCGARDVQPVRALQASVESVRGNTLTRLWEKAGGDAAEAQKLSKNDRKAILKPVAAAKKAQAEELMNQIDTELPKVIKAIEKGKDTSASTVADADATAAVEEGVAKIQGLVGGIEECMIPEGYASAIPKGYGEGLPKLNGRATIEMVLKRPPNSDQKKYEYQATLYEDVTLKITVDGYAAPLNAGNFVDLVDKGFYTGMSIQRADGFITQFGDPGKEAGNGYKPEGSKKLRTVPLEVALFGKETLYGETVDEAMAVGRQVKIPFQADGTIASARAEFDNDSASSQFFWIQFEPDMTPAGKNLLDGRYSSFGYAVSGSEFLRQIKEGDMIISAKVIDGLDKLQRPA